MMEILENLAQLISGILFQSIPAVVAIPLGDLGKFLIKQDAYRYFVVIIAFIVLTGTYTLIKKTIKQ